jgi:hypothetical protein
MKDLSSSGGQLKMILFISLFIVIKLNGYTQSVDYGKSYVNIYKGAGGGRKMIKPGQ